MRHIFGFPGPLSTGLGLTAVRPGFTTVRPELVEGRFKAGGLQPRRLQRGIAALEFALLALFVMLPMFLGIFVFWEVLQTQQVVTRATGDGARQVVRMLHAPKSDGTAHSEAEALAAAKASISAALRSHLGEVDTLPVVTLGPDATGSLELNVTYTRHRLLGNAAGLNFIEPQTLQARSVIQ